MGFLKTAERAEDTENKQPSSVNSGPSVVDYLYNLKCKITAALCLLDAKNLLNIKVKFG